MLVYGWKFQSFNRYRCIGGIVEKKAVQVQMLESTLDKIDGMKRVLHTENRSEIVKTSIDITEIIANAIKDGGSVTVEKNGEKMKLIIPGI
jgi:hypothetical protein